MADSLFGCSSQGFNSFFVVQCYEIVVIPVVWIYCADLKHRLLKYGSPCIIKHNLATSCKKTPAKSTACIKSSVLLKEDYCEREATVLLQNLLQP